MSLRDQLEAIRQAHGRLTPTLVVDEARPEDHPLHDRFEWDDSVAGEAWRRRQAHELIRSLRVVYKPATETTPEKTVRAYHAVHAEDGHVYEPAEKVANDEFLSRLVMADMERDWKQLRRRWQDFQEFWEMIRGELAEAA